METDEWVRIDLWSGLQLLQAGVRDIRPVLRHPSTASRILWVPGRREMRGVIIAYEVLKGSEAHKAFQVIQAAREEGDY